MFRQMRRKKQEISADKCKEILTNELRGVMGVIGDDGYPYTLPLNHYYDRKSNKLYFHGAQEGHKIDSIKNNNKVSYCVLDKGYTKDGEWSLNINSVIVFGKAHIIDDEDKIKEICYNLGHKFTDDENYLNDEYESNYKRVLCFEIEIEHMTGKLVNES